MSASDRKVVFILGGVRSGKSRLALKLANELSGDAAVRFIATAPRLDDDLDMARRIARHRSERPDNWTTFEEPFDLPAALNTAGPERAAVIDCLTLWLSNLLAECGDPEATEFSARAMTEVTRRVDPLIEALDMCSMHVILIANEVGSGVSPATRLGNVFADAQGETNQRIAAASDEVYHLVAGIAQRIK